MRRGGCGAGEGARAGARSLSRARPRRAKKQNASAWESQSPALLDLFEPEEVVVAERSLGATSFRRLDPAELATWLEEYSLSELRPPPRMPSW